MTRSVSRHLIRWSIAALGALAAIQAAAAFTVTTFTPQGEVAQVRQVVARFSEDVVRFGDPKAPAPFTLHCDGAGAAGGTARWLSGREWVYDFAADLPPGVRCEALAAADFKSIGGATLKGPDRFAFTTGGPAVVWLRPYLWSKIEEDQAFVLKLNGAATTESVREHVWCAVDGLGERVPIRLLDDQERAGLLQGLRLARDAEKDPQRYFVFSCNRRLTPATQVEVVYGAGVATPSGVANAAEQRFAFTVREPFTASTTCERENAQAACLPVRPISVTFSAPVARQALAQIRLRSDKTELTPTLPSGDGDQLLENVAFDAPLPERTRFELTLPAGLVDSSGRPLANADAFPLAIATGPMPPLAKFAAAPFGIVERFAEGPDGPALMPITLRRVEPELQAHALQLGDFQPQSDAEIIAWFTRVQRYDNWMVPREMAERDVLQPLPPPITSVGDDQVESRMVSLLAGRSHVQTIALPEIPQEGLRPFEVVGVPLDPGYHVLEVGSHLLGEALLDPDYGADRRMVVRTSVLVTNLGVHFKLGRENALAWVTTLDKGLPVAGASVQVSDCAGRAVAQATTDASGLAHFRDLSSSPPDCRKDGDYLGDFQSAWFVSARASSGGKPDMAFTWSSWQRGIEPWRFNVPTSAEPAPDVLAHTVFDRTLLRAGETVSMKHLLRTETEDGFDLPRSTPAKVVITHAGSGQEYTLPLKWRKTATGGLSAESTFAIPAAAKLGIYWVALQDWSGKPAKRAGDEANGADDPGALGSGSFRVEEFRLPVLQGRIGPKGDEPLVAATQVPVEVQINYVSGGPAAHLPVRVSAVTRPAWVGWADYGEFSFSPPRASDDGDAGADEDGITADQDESTKVVADKLALTLDANGVGTTVIEPLAPSERARTLVMEATFADPNGELQTLHATRTLWPAALVAGIRAGDWVSVDRQAEVEALALDLDGKPRAGVPLDVRARTRTTTTSRKRLVGGFYTYDSHTETHDLGTVCTGTSDARGVLACKVKLAQPGEVELVASARDAAGNVALAATSVWVTGQGELWFGGRDDDRIDVLAEKKVWQPGDIARLQVRMPFRRATALVAVEREGVMETQVVELRGDDPTVSVKIGADWAPNVYVSVLALRGRIYETPWYSFFTWGWRTPRGWWRAFREDSKAYVPPTAMVDLSKPAFRFGMAELKIADSANALAVDVKPERTTYQVRDTAKVTVSVRKPDGQPAAHAEVALAAVDQALLELWPNSSWDLLGAMLRSRAWGVQTATAQMEIVGRRHYGRKAVPAGGDGGATPTRELLDTLLLWQPRIDLDARGQAEVDVPLNDALTRFQIVAVADMGTRLFGTGRAAIRATQDLQIISGIPPLARAGDAFTALATLRNTTDKAMKVEVTPRVPGLTLAPQTLEVPAGGASETRWSVSVPAQLASTHADELAWEIEARDLDGTARDALKVSQKVAPAVPLTVQQGGLIQLDSPFAAEVAPPADALAVDGVARGGIRLALQPKLADGLPAIRDWFARYPYSCLEQQTSKAIGMDDRKAWDKLTTQLPAYLDRDGLAYYFPPRSGAADDGSDTLTAWLLAATHEAARFDPAWRLPDDSLQHMIQGLTAFVEGRIARQRWSPRAQDLDVRKLAAIEALSRYGAARAAMLDTLTIAPSQWPTSALIDWINILRRVDGIAQKPRLEAQATQNLRARLSLQGTRLVFSTEKDDAWWWLMAGGDVNAARLLITVMDDPQWKADMGRLVTGFVQRQKDGTWNTTTANLWGTLALRDFSRAFESTPVTGVTHASLADEDQAVRWNAVHRVKTGEVIAPDRFFTAPPQPGELAGNTMAFAWPGSAGDDRLTVTHNGGGAPWLTLQALAAVELKAPFFAGFQVRKTITPIEQANSALPAGEYTRGDILRVTLEVTGANDMTWVAVTDPIPAGATILGSGLGRDSAIATRGEKQSGWNWPAFEERSFESFRAYYDYLPKGTVKTEYTVRLNTAGRFQLPPTRVEAIYAPEMFGAAPNAPIAVRMP